MPLHAVGTLTPGVLQGLRSFWGYPFRYGRYVCTLSSSHDAGAMCEQAELRAQAVVLLVFMFSANWRLTVMTLILVPLNLQICAVYGQFYKRLVKEMQTKLAHANVIADEVSLITCSAASLFGRPLSDTDWQCASLSRLLRAACSGPNDQCSCSAGHQHDDHCAGSRCRGRIHGACLYMLRHHS